jgi:hypothetical protein
VAWLRSDGLSAESAVVVTDIDHLGLVISHATAPAFMLGAVAAFLSILIQRMERISDRIRALRADDSSGADSKKALLQALDRRVMLLGRAIYFGACLSGCLTRGETRVMLWKRHATLLSRHLRGPRQHRPASERIY